MTTSSDLQSTLNPKKPNGYFSSFLTIIAMAAAYLIAGKLGHALAFMLGHYASPIWPPAGIALAGALIYGKRVWPGILLGAFLINGLNPLVASFKSGEFNTLLITLAISSGATLQTLGGAYLLERYANFPNALMRKKEIFWFVLYAGVLSTLINSTLSVSVLIGTDKIPLADALNNWLTWWTGDLLGVIIFTPLTLAWIQKNTDDWRHRQLAITLPIISMLALTTTAVVYEAQSSNQRIQLEFEQHIKDLNNSLKIAIDNDVHILGALKSFFLHSAEVNREEFKLFTEDLLKDYHDIQSMSWDPLIHNADRVDFEKKIQQEGFPNFQIFELDTNRQAVRAKEKSSYVVVTYTEPYKGNEKALGYDISSNPTRLAAINIATDSGELTITSRIKLIQDKSQFSVLALMPVYSKTLVQNTLEEKHLAILGFVVGIIRTDNVIISALKDSNTLGLSYRLLDSTAPAMEQILYSSDELFPEALVIQQQTWYSDKKTLNSSEEVNLGGRVWKFEIVPNQNYFATHYSGHVRLVMSLGLLLTSLITLISLLASGRTRWLEQVINESTKEIKQQHAQTLSLMHETENLHERLNSILNATGEGIFGIGLDGVCVFINASALTMLGFDSQQEVLGKNCHKLFHYAHVDGSDYELEHCPIYKALQGESNSLIDSEVFWRKDGSSFPVQYQAHPIIQEAKIIGSVVSFTDITERKQKDRLLLVAKERAENLAKTKSQFLANMSHEIRTPMAAIIGFSELALLHDMPKKVGDFLKNINTASNKLLIILNDILDLSKLEAGKMQLNLSPFSLDDLQNTLYNLFINSANNKDLNLTINVANNVPEYLIGDNVRIRQVLINLLGNAIKFTNQGEVTLNISLQQLDETQALVLFAVTDSGIGIAQEQQDKLFLPFSQVDDGYARNYEGTGLGLVISQDLVKMMNSLIKVDSHLDLGSSFSFELMLPLVPLSTLETIKTGANPSSLITETEALKGIRVLVAEDDAFNQKIIKQVLKRLGVSIIVLANNGSEALRALEQDDFDVVLMDLHMPIMNGYEASTEIRKNPRYAQLAVIALSASVTEEDRQRSLAAGMNDFISKPINVNTLLSTVQKWLNREPLSTL
ncbi:MAG: CHASE domain-containing protein [Methylococcales bacterium]